MEEEDDEKVKNKDSNLEYHKYTFQEINRPM